MNAYTPGILNVLHNFPDSGLHPSMSFASWMDSVPEVIYQTPDSMYRAGIATNNQYDPVKYESPTSNQAGKFRVHTGKKR